MNALIWLIVFVLGGWSIPTTGEAVLVATPASSDTSPIVMTPRVGGTTQDVTIRNVGDERSSRLKTALRRTPRKGAFTISSDGCRHRVLAPGATCVVRVRYSAKAAPPDGAEAVLTVSGRNAIASISYFKVTDTDGAPEASPDSASVTEDTAPNPIQGNVLTNDSDPDGDALVVTSAGTFLLPHGTVVMNANGSYTYTLDNSDPDVNALNDSETLTNSFTYSISDGHGGTDSAKLTITINGNTDNRPPEASPDSASVTEDTAPNPIQGNVLTNDSDPDGDALVVTSAGTFLLPHGTVVINANGSYTYTLDNSDPDVNALNDSETLTNSFTYSISDGHGGTDSAKLTITINGNTDNRPPEASPDSASVTEDTAPNPIQGNVLTNDSDPDGDALVVTSAGTFLLPHGTVVINANGSYTYTLDNSDPDVNALNDSETLTNSFTYSISDGHGGTDSAKLTITINGNTD